MGAPITLIRHSTRINPERLSPTTKESRPNIPPPMRHTEYSKKFKCSLLGLSFANTPAPIPFGPNAGTDRPYNFTTSLFHTACNTSYQYHTPKQSIFMIHFAKNVIGERKYKWSNAKYPPKMVSPRNTL